MLFQYAWSRICIHNLIWSQLKFGKYNRWQWSNYKFQKAILNKFMGTYMYALKKKSQKNYNRWRHLHLIVFVHGSIVKKGRLCGFLCWQKET